MSNVSQNIHDFWPHAMDVTKDRKTNSNIKSSFMHNLLHTVIYFFVLLTKKYITVCSKLCIHDDLMLEFVFLSFVTSMWPKIMNILCNVAHFLV